MQLQKICWNGTIFVVSDFIFLLTFNYSFRIFYSKLYIYQILFFTMDTSHHVYWEFKVFKHVHIICICWCFSTTETFGLLNLVQYYFIDRVIFIYNFKGINFPNLIHSSIIICWYLHMISLWLVIFKYLIMGELNVFQNSLLLK